MCECSDKQLFLSKCSKGIKIFLEHDDYVFLNISCKSKCITIRGVQECSYFIFNFIPAEYFYDNEKELELTLTTGNGTPILFQFSDVCQLTCGVKVNITDSCHQEYLYLNEECQIEPISRTWIITYKNCIWNIPIITKEFNFKKMNRIVLGGREFILKENPLLYLSGGVSINPEFAAELDLIDKDAFQLELVDDAIQMTYVGLKDIQVFDNYSVLYCTCNGL